MPFDASGTFSRLRGNDSWKGDATAGTKIKSDLHDTNDNDLADGLSTCLTKDGRTQPTANLPMAGKKLTNLGPPTSDTDAATKAYVDQLKTFTTGLSISGADVNGRLNFVSTTGANGLSFIGADLSWLAKIFGNPVNTRNRLVLNDKADGTGTDAIAITELGMIFAASSSYFGGNMFYSSEATPQWRAINAGWTPLYIGNVGDGAHRFYASTASVAAGAVAALNVNFTINADGSASARGAFSAGGRVSGTDILSQGIVYAANGASYLNTDGNLVGSIWNNWGSSNAYTAISNQIEARGQAWANDRVSNLQYRKVSQGNFGYGPGQTAPAGAVINGGYWAGTTLMGMYYMYLQVYDPVRGWVGFSG